MYVFPEHLSCVQGHTGCWVHKMNDGSVPTLKKNTTQFYSRERQTNQELHYSMMISQSTLDSRNKQCLEESISGGQERHHRTWHSSWILKDRMVLSGQEGRVALGSGIKAHGTLYKQQPSQEPSEIS